MKSEHKIQSGKGSLHIEMDQVPKILKRFWLSLVICGILIAGMIILSSNLMPIGWRVESIDWAVIFPLSVVAGCHILFPVRTRRFRLLYAILI